MRPESRNRLEAFVAVVDEIETYSIFEKADMIVECRIHEKDGHLVVDYDGPSTEQLNAVLLRLRLFLRRDDLSFARMAQLYDDPGVSETWKAEHRRWRTEFNARLDDRVAAEGDARGVLTHRQVFDMFLYGRLGHLEHDDAAYRLYDLWITDEASRESFLHTFQVVVVWLLASSTTSPWRRVKNSRARAITDVTVRERRRE